jgi:hypothetical protein
MTEKQESILRESFYNSPIFKYYEEKGEKRAAANADLAAFAKTSAGKARFRKSDKPGTRELLSKAHKGKKLSSYTREALKRSNYRYTIPVERILEVQTKTSTAKEAAKLLGVTFNTYKDICIFHSIYKKEDHIQRNKELTGHACHCWKYDPTKKDSKGEYVGKFKSRKEAGDALGGISSGNIGLVLNKTYKQARGYYFEKIN